MSTVIERYTELWSVEMKIKLLEFIDPITTMQVLGGITEFGNSLEHYLRHTYGYIITYDVPHLKEYNSMLMMQELGYDGAIYAYETDETDMLWRIYDKLDDAHKQRITNYLIRTDYSGCDNSGIDPSYVDDFYR